MLRFLCICWRIIWKEWLTFWHADVSRWPTLGRHRYRRVLVLFHAVVRLSNWPWAWVCVYGQITWKKWSTFGMLMYSDDLPSADIDADYYCCHSMRSSVRSTVQGPEFLVLRTNRLEEKVCTLACWCIRMMPTSAPMGLVVIPCVRPSLQPRVCLGWVLMWINRFEEVVYILTCWCIQMT